MPGCFVSIRYNARGPVNASVSACATGISGIGEGMRRIIWGDADVMLVGGTESAITTADYRRVWPLDGAFVPERYAPAVDYPLRLQPRRNGGG